MKRFLIYPILFALNYALFKDLRPADTFRVSGILTIIIGVLIVGLYRLVRNWHRAGYIALITSIWLLYYGTAVGFLQVWLRIDYSTWHHLISMAAWILLFGFLGSTWLWKKLPKVDNITSYFNTLFLFLLIYNGLNVIRIETHRFLVPPQISMSQVASSVEISTRPDIYYIIVDGYSRQDTLQEIYSFDNSAFIDYLTNSGFYIAEKSHSNYMQTVLSITSSLNMNYLNSTSINTVRRSEFIDLIANNEVRTFLEALDYRTVSLSSYFYITDITNTDVYYSLSKRGAPAYPETQVVNSSIGNFLMQFHLLPWVEYTFQDQQERIYFTLDEIGKVSSLPGPKFVFAHIVSPHPAFLFNENGPVTPEKIYGYNSGTFQENLMNYPKQVVYMNRLLENMIDNILKNSTSPPIIILQADHGTELYFDLYSAENTCMRERAAILNAYHFPDQDSNPIYPTITPVNTFRLVFNQYFGTQFEILEDQVFYSSGSQPFLFRNVTDRISEACTLP